MTICVTNLGEFVGALWVLATQGAQSLDNRSGVVDRALHDIKDMLPARISHELTFSHTGVGLRCLQWPTAVLYMEDALIAQCDGSTYTTLSITLSLDQAIHILYDLGLNPQERMSLAKSFHKAIETSRRIR